MATQLAPAPAGIGGSDLVKAATAAGLAAAGKPYTWGGHSVNGFDCSGFVIYSLRQAYPQHGWSWITAGQIFQDGRFTTVTDPQPGDLICFRHGSGVVHDHVGIVVDANSWIGSQSSTGVATVSMSNVYWASKPHFFLRLK